MSGKSRFAEDAEQEKRLDVELNEVLGDFRASVHAWSEAAYSRPRTALAAAPRSRVWRLAAGWALGCVLVAGAAFGWVYVGVQERHHRQELAQIATVKALKVVEQQKQVVVRQVAVQQAQEEEEGLLAKVDSAVSRQTPSAMEPLAQLMTMDDSQ